MVKGNHPRADLYREEYAKGMTYAEIARKYGVSRQAVQMACGKQDVSKFRPWTEDRCIYPNLRKWLNDNRVSLFEFVRRMEAIPSGHITYRYSCYFKGGIYPQKRTIDKMLEVTGLTYEQMWEVEDG